MVTYTPNYHMTKPNPDEIVKIGDLNANADTTDTTLKTFDTRIGVVEGAFTPANFVPFNSTPAAIGISKTTVETTGFAAGGVLPISNLWTDSPGNPATYANKIINVGPQGVLSSRSIQVSLTLPTDAQMNYLVGTRFLVVQYGSVIPQQNLSVSVGTEAGGPTLIYLSSQKATVVADNKILVTKVAANTWEAQVLPGNLEAIPLNKIVKSNFIASTGHLFNDYSCNPSLRALNTWISNGVVKLGDLSAVPLVGKTLAAGVTANLHFYYTSPAYESVIMAPASGGNFQASFTPANVIAFEIGAGSTVVALGDAKVVGSWNAGHDVLSIAMTAAIVDSLRGKSWGLNVLFNDFGESYTCIPYAFKLN